MGMSLAHERFLEDRGPISYSSVGTGKMGQQNCGGKTMSKKSASGVCLHQGAPASTSRESQSPSCGAL